MRRGGEPGKCRVQVLVFHLVDESPIHPPLAVGNPCHLREGRCRRCRSFDAGLDERNMIVVTGL